MPARSVVLRVFAAVAVLVACFGIGSTAAHAVNQSASATLQCEQIPGSQYKTAVWHVHLENNEPGPNGHLFLVDSTDAFNNYGANYNLLPGETKDVTSQGIDGLGANLVVSSDLAVLIRTGTSIVCNPPTVDITLQCPPGGVGMATLVYTMTNLSPSHYNGPRFDHSGDRRNEDGERADPARRDLSRLGRLERQQDQGRSGHALVSIGSLALFVLRRERAVGR